MTGWTENNTKITDVITKQVLESEILKLKEYLEKENILSFKLQAKKELLEELQDEIPKTETTIFVINKINKKLETIDYDINRNYEAINAFQVEISLIERLLNEKLIDIDALDNYEIKKFNVNYETWMNDDELSKFINKISHSETKEFLAQFTAISKKE